MEIVEFLAACLDEDERIARAAGGRSEQVWEADLSGKDPLGMPSWPVAVRYVTDGRLRGAVANLPVMNERSEDRMVHIAVHDPARVLREIDAKRRIVQALESAEVAVRNTEPGKEPHELMTGAVNSLRAAVRMLAAVYADRPGFREEWLP